MTPRSAAERRVAACHAAFYVSSGIWPVLHRRSFEAITGPKTDFWLAQTVGLTVVAIGAGLAQAAIRSKPVSADLYTTAIGGASALATIDLFFVLRRRISPIYLLDAAAEATLIVAWVKARRLPDHPRS